MRSTYKIAAFLFVGALIGSTAGSAYALGRHKGGGHGNWQNIGNNNSTVDVVDNNGNKQTLDITQIVDHNGNSNPVPEPVTGLLFGAGLLGAAGYRRLRKRFQS